MILKSLIAFAFVCSATAQSASSVGTCTSYPTTGICSSYINYSIYLPPNTTIDQIDSQLKPYAGLAATYGNVSLACVDTFIRFACENAYPKCETTDGVAKVYTACYDDCVASTQYCSSLFKMAGMESLLPDCSAVSPSTQTALGEAGSCNSIQSKYDKETLMNNLFNISTVPANFAVANCPLPFVQDPLAASNSTLNPDYCKFGCCIPCPAQNLFYKENWAEDGFLATDIVRFISSVLSLVLLISYIILPDKRRHPSLLILNMSLSIFLFSMVVFFSVGNPKRLQCAADGINPGEFSNNHLCAAQGAILIFGSFATCLWCAALILNLHVHTVWNSNFFTNKYALLNLICWGIPAAIMSIALGLHAIKFEFANLCLVSMDYIFPMFFYPLAAIVCPSFLIHISTFFYIAKIAVREGLETDMTQSLSTGTMTDRPIGVSRKHVMTAVKIQWRALLLAIIAVATVLFYWLFYMTQMSHMTEVKNDPSLTLSWLGCMFSKQDQNTCSEILKPHLPPFPLMIVAETLVSSIGIWLFVMFAKRSLWREWNDWIYEVRVRFTKQGRVEKNGDQFYAL